MKNNLLIVAAFGVIGASSLVSCTRRLNTVPPNAQTGSQVFSTPLGATEALANVYGAFALTGSNGPSTSDLVGIDAGTSDFVRMLWDASELSTDEAVCAWNDPGVPDFHNMAWNSSNEILMGLYYRIMYQITVANSFMQQAAGANTSSWSAGAKDTLQLDLAEVRYIRAFQYWEMMDLYGSPPFVTEKDPIGSFVPPQITRANLFSWVESELLSLDSAKSLAAPMTNDYGRVDQACVWALLARMYLNADVYLGSGNDHYTQAITYANKVIAAGYSLLPEYKNLFRADNNTKANTEQIFSIQYDGNSTQTYGGTTFIINAAIGGSMSAAAYGLPAGGWAGNRVTANVPNLFPDLTGTGDKRGMFYTSGQSEAIASIGDFNDGLAVTKWQNVTSTGATPPGATTFATTNFPLFRLAEMYMIYAEAVLRNGTGGTMAQAVTYFNALRTRAGATTMPSITLQNIIDERGREFYWECMRRTDLVRFGLFTSESYLWPWKGGVPSGTGVDDHFNLFPIPAADQEANPNLIQNTGY